MFGTDPLRPPGDGGGRPWQPGRWTPPPEPGCGDSSDKVLLGLEPDDEPESTRFTSFDAVDGVPIRRAPGVVGLRERHGSRIGTIDGPLLGLAENTGLFQVHAGDPPLACFRLSGAASALYSARRRAATVSLSPLRVTRHGAWADDILALAVNSVPFAVTGLGGIALSVGFVWLADRTASWSVESPRPGLLSRLIRLRISATVLSPARVVSGGGGGGFEPCAFCAHAPNSGAEKRPTIEATEPPARGGPMTLFWPGDPGTSLLLRVCMFILLPAILVGGFELSDSTGTGGISGRLAAWASPAHFGDASKSPSGRDT